MYCSEHLPVKLVPDQEEGRKHPPAKYGQLTFSTWLLSWDPYSLAAAMLKQMDIRVALTHKLVVSKVAQQATPKRSENLAVVYDWLLRQAICFRFVQYPLQIVPCASDANGRTRAASWERHSALMPWLASRTKMC